MVIDNTIEQPMGLDEKILEKVKLDVRDILIYKIDQVYFSKILTEKNLFEIIESCNASILSLC